MIQTYKKIPIFLCIFAVPTAKNMRKLLLLTATALLALSSCSEMDPFTGTEGIRFNLNGKKYVMQSDLFKISPLKETADSVTISSTLSGPSAIDICSFYLKLCPLEQLAADKEYNTGENGISAEISAFSMGFADIASAVSSASETKEQAAESESETTEKSSAPVQLQGWVKRVASEDAKLELLFEFSGKDDAGNEYVIKHGFLRL